MPNSLYEEDFLVWTRRQAEELRRAAHAGSNLPLDWENLAEEIESLGNRDRREAESFVRLILVHLVKLACSPTQEPRAGWRKEIREFRFQLGQVLKDSPSLKAKLDDIVDGLWDKAVQAAVDDLRTNNEYEAARPRLDLWKKRCLTAEDISDDELDPEPGSNRMVKAE